MMRVLHVVLLRVLPAFVVVLGALRAAGMLERGRPSPRELAGEFMRAVRVEGSALSRGGDRGVGGALFTDVAPEMGLHFVHDNAARGNFMLPEEMGPGAGWLDFDGDGDLDLFIGGGGAIVDDGPAQSCRLYRNDRDRFTDVTDEAGAGVPGPAYGVACADYDGDGDVDIFVSRLGTDALLRNDGLHFTEVGAAAGVAATGFGASAAFFDYDLDGRLDLYVTRYVDWSPGKETTCYTILGQRDYCKPTTYQSPSRDLLYRNLGDGRFEDVSAAAGIAAAAGNGLGVVAGDFDGDGRPDLYVANDQTPAFLWRNDGDGTFSEIAVVAGCAYDRRGVAIAGMGVAAEDLDGDGDLDLFVTNIQDQTSIVLRNDGGLFEDVSLGMGLGRWSLPATAFGVAIFDQDHDGRLDAFIANGEVNINNAMPAGDNPYAQPNQFVRLVDSRFVDATAAAGAFGGVSRGVAAADFDDDGDVDLLVTNNGGAVQLLRNDHDGTGHWIGLDVRARSGGPAAIGAHVTVRAGGRVFTREVRPQQSYLCSGDHRVHVGLGDAAAAERIDVRWPDGRQVALEQIPADRYHLVDPGVAP